MTGIYKELSTDEVAKARAQANDIAHASMKVVDDNKFVFFAAFDGTNNSDDPAFANNSQDTAVHQIFAEVSEANSKQDNISARYFPGVGTPPTETGSSAIPTSQIIQTAQDAYDAFAIAAAQWKQGHPEGEITSMIMSFSRGGGSAAVFAQMIYEKGLVTQDNQVLIPPGKVGAISSALILDPVTTGVFGNMSFPDTVQNLTVIRADDEHRSLFKAVDYAGSNTNILHATGNHGDIGAFYDIGLGGMYLEAYHDYFKNAGLKVLDVPADRKFDGSKPTVIHSESMMSLGQTVLSPWNSLTDDSNAPRNLNPAGPATRHDGDGTVFTDYKGTLVIGGDGASVNVSENSVIVLPKSSATITGIGMEIVAEESSTVHVISNAQITGDYGNPITTENGPVVTGSATVIHAGKNSSIDVTGANVTIKDGTNARYIKMDGDLNKASVVFGDTTYISAATANPNHESVNWYTYKSVERNVDENGNFVGLIYSYKATNGRSLSLTSNADGTSQGESVNENGDTNSWTRQEGVFKSSAKIGGVTSTLVLMNDGSGSLESNGGKESSSMIWNAEGEKTVYIDGKLVETTTPNPDGSATVHNFLSEVESPGHWNPPIRSIVGSIADAKIRNDTFIFNNFSVSIYDEKYYDDGAYSKFSTNPFSSQSNFVSIDRFGNTETRNRVGGYNWTGELHETNGTVHIREGNDEAIISDTWTARDGSHGTDIYQGTILAKRISYNTDNSIDRVTYEQSMPSTSVHFSANGEQTTSFQLPDGTSVSTVFGIDGSSTKIEKTQAGTMKAYTDYRGHLVSDAWETTAGAHGETTYFSDGTKSSTSYSERDAQGNYSITTVDRERTTETSFYDKEEHITKLVRSTEDGTISSDSYYYTEIGEYTVNISTDLYGDSHTTVHFGEGIASEDIHIQRKGDDLSLVLDTVSQEVLLKEWGLNQQNRNVSIVFENGTEWDSIYLAQQIDNPPILGSSGNDKLAGWSGFNESLYGLQGDDYLSGNDGNDILDGGTGDDTLVGGSGGDTYIFDKGDGLDTISESGYNYGINDIIRFGNGISASDVEIEKEGINLVFIVKDSNDQITIKNPWYWPGMGADYQIEKIEFADGTVWDTNEYIKKIVAKPVLGTEVYDYMRAWDGMNEHLRGLGGDDYIIGGTGNDVLEGGTGADYLRGGDGSDTYRFNKGDGNDTLSEYDYDSTNIDIIDFGIGISADEITMSRKGGNLILAVGEADDTISIENWFYNQAYRVEGIRFADGTFWNNDNLRSMTSAIPIVGTNGDDYLLGTDGKDRILGNGGNDYLSGGSGDDRYIFDSQSGKDTIWEDGINGPEGDVIQFSNGVVESDIQMSRRGSDLVLSIGGGENEITVANWKNGTDSHIEKIEFSDGSTWDSQEIGNRLSNTSLLGSDGSDFLIGWGMFDENLAGLEGNDQLFGAASDDTLTGGRGNDYLVGGGGSDTYIFNRGDGADIISEYGSAGANFDRIKFGEGIDETDIEINRSGGDILLSINGTHDEVAIWGWAYGREYRIEEIDFADGKTWDAAALAEKIAKPIVGSDGYDYLSAWSGLNETLVGRGGDDYLFGNDGNDTLEGGSGNDYLAGRSGSDTYVFERGFGSDTITEEGGLPHDTDVIRFGAGISMEQIAVVRKGHDLLLIDRENGGEVTIQGWGSDIGNQIEKVEFIDGSAWNKSALLSMIDSTSIGSASVDFIKAWDGVGERIDGLGGNDALMGADGKDTLNGGAGSDLIIGGAGNDLISTGIGHNVIAFNRNDGNDLVVADEGAENTVSLGGGIAYSDLSLAKSGNDLVLNIGADAGMTFSEWYTADENHTVTKLQVIIDGTDSYNPQSNNKLLCQAVQEFDFLKLVNEFNNKVEASPSLSSWSIASSLLDSHIGSSDTAAIGGDGTYYYATYGSLDYLSDNQVKLLLVGDGFGKEKENTSIIF